MQHTDAKTPASGELKWRDAESGATEPSGNADTASHGSPASSAVEGNDPTTPRLISAGSKDPATDLPPQVDPAVVDSVSAARDDARVREAHAEPAPGWGEKGRPAAAEEPFAPPDGLAADGVPLESEVHELAPEQPADSVGAAPQDTPYVVGVGASAGGLDALEQFFGAMPEDTGMAFVVIQHLSPDFKSVMDELLARRTKIPVVLVENGMQVEANHIYLIPPKKVMIISGGKLLLSDKGVSQELMLPIDIFFRSLAEDLGSRAVGIVLSGAGSDGARGIRDIHDAGGLVLSQDESSAYFDGMPRSARETGVVDFILAPAQMPSALLEHARNPEEHRRVQGLASSPSRPYGVAAALRFLQNTYGIDFTHYKPSTVVRRIERRLQLTQSGSLEAYVERLANDTAELDDLFHDLLIGVTRFFRDGGAFSCLEERIIPELVERSKQNDELRVWVAGCATGEEAYSLAILMQEELRKRGARCRLKILATDLHRGSLDFASRGLYNEDRVTGVRPDLLERYFDKRGPSYQVSPELRQCVVFAPHNVIKDAPFTRIDLCTCRNLLIYLQPLAQKKVLGLLHFALKRNGVLVLGPSEHVGPLVDDFEAVDVHWRIYRKHRDLRPGTDVSRVPPPQRALPVASDSRGGAFGGHSLTQTIGVYDALLEEYMPPSLLVSERRELIHAFSGASRYLKVKEGRPSNDLLDMIGPDLKMAVTGAMQRALKERTAVTYTGLSLTVDGKTLPHRLLVKPVLSGGAQHVLITITPLEGDDRPAVSQSELDLSEVSRDQVGSLEAELRRTKESLQATIEELETSNEELQATNEELLASNEELQSTNEELQSVNEELYTVNAEYQKKIGELTELTNDVDNLLASIEVGTIFLDRKLCIRKFTPLIAEVFNLLPQDVGRPITGFSTSLNQASLMDDLTRVLHTEQAIEREVQSRDQNWYFQRILPYRMRGTVHGVVLTLIDIGPLKAAENAVFRERYLLDSLMDSVPDAIYFKDASGHFVRVNQAMAERLALRSPALAAGRSERDFMPDSIARAMEAADARALAGEIQPYRQELVAEAGDTSGWFMTTRQPLRDGDGEIVGMLSVSRDISEQKRIEDEMRLAVRRRDEFLAMLSHELRNPLAAIVNAGVLLHSDEATPSTRGKSLQVIERQSRQMTRLLDDLLEVSRITQGKIELRKQTTDVRNVANEALVALKDRFASRGIELSCDLGEQPVLAEADPARLQQIIVNLLDNAVKYTSARYSVTDGPLTPSSARDSWRGLPDTERGKQEPSGGKASLRLEVEGDEAVLTISDNGMGMDPSLLGNVFEPFVQGAATIHRTDGGMGIGLSVVRSLVDMHGGRIEAHSDGHDRGSTFVVRLPLAPPSALAPRTRRTTPWPTGKRVVVIEDNPDGAEMLSLLLEHAGYEVFTAEDGQRGVELIARVEPHVALVDIGLPVMDGYEVARWVRQQPQHEQLYLLALTGYGQAGDRAAALEAGFDEHLVKPVDSEVLRQLLRAKDTAPG
jgi:two-component system CheB/CheR fusion protein